MEDSKTLNTPEIFTILDKKTIQNIQDFFATTLDIGILNIYEDSWLTDPSNPSDFCKEYIKKSKFGYKRCEECHKIWETAAKEHGKPMINKCFAGLTAFAIPVKISGKYLGCLLGGQILTEAPDEKQLRKIAKKNEFNEDEFIAEMKNIKILPEDRVRSIIDLLYLVAHSVTVVAKTNHSLEKMGINCNFPKNFALEEWFLQKYAAIKRPLSSRENEVLKLIVLGKNNNEIAKELFISIHTVKIHVSSIIEKLEVDDRVQVAVKAIREGLL